MEQSSTSKNLAEMSAKEVKELLKPKTTYACMDFRLNYGEHIVLPVDDMTKLIDLLSKAKVRYYDNDYNFRKIKPFTDKRADTGEFRFLTEEQVGEEMVRHVLNLEKPKDE